jgi:hypothetical protein
MIELFGRDLLDRFNEIAVTSQCLIDLRQLSGKNPPYGIPRATIANLRVQAGDLQEQCQKVGLLLSTGTVADLVMWLDRALIEKRDDEFVELGGEVLARVQRYLDEVRNILRRELEARKIWIVEAVHNQYLEPAAPLFGSPVHEKFKATRHDIEEAARCLAFGQSTACVFHLMRAMEVVVRRLAIRLGIPNNPKVTWRVLTGNMDDKIKKMLDATAAQRRKKEAWTEARTNLHHVGEVWRNKTMHPAKSYTQPQAEDIWNAVRVFMTGFAEL